MPNKKTITKTNQKKILKSFFRTLFFAGSADCMVSFGSNRVKFTKKSCLLELKSIIVLVTQTVSVQEVQRLAMKQRIRGLVEAEDGSIWGIEDGKHAALFQLTAPKP